MAERIHDFLGAPHPLRTIPGFYAPRPGIQIGCSIAHDASDDHLQLLQQYLLRPKKNDCSFSLCIGGYTVFAAIGHTACSWEQARR